MPQKKAIKKKNKKQVKARKQREVTGLILVAVGLFLFTCMLLSSTGVLGRAVKPVMYGLFGLSAYFMPILIAGIGGAIAIMDKKKMNRGKVLVILLFIVVFLNLAHIVSVRILNTSSFGAFISSSYKMGLEIKGQGAFNAVLSYPVWKLVGTTGSMIFYGFTILVLLVIFTNMSIKKVSNDVKERIDDTKVYIEKRKEEYAVKRQERQEKRAARLYNDTIDPETGEVLDEDLDVMELNKEHSRFKSLLNSGKRSINNVFEGGEEEEATVAPPVAPSSVFCAPLNTAEKTIPDFKSDDKKVISIKDASDYKPAPNEESQKEGFLHLLKDPEVGSVGGNKQELEYKSNMLESTLESFRIKAKVVNVTCGPSITRYELQPAHGVKISSIVGLQDDIKMALAARDIRIEAPIPGKNAVGIEIPNDKVRTVYLKEVLNSAAFKNKIKSKLAFALGIDIDGNSVVADLQKMPHMLVAGTTGAGKSVCVNNIILSYLFNSTPDEVRMIMIDPKMVEMTSYNDLPHMLIPVVTDSNKAASALRWALNEMEMRYKLFSKAGVKELSTYNAILGEDEDKKPAIVVFVDELADLMMVAKNEVEDIICRIAQKGRAAGIHLVLATQRPSVNVITGVIKANIPSRIAFHVVSAIDSRTILDSVGAERLLGRGDMLFLPNGAAAPKRLQGAFVSEEEIRDITDYIKENEIPQYSEEIMQEIEKDANTAMGLGNDEGGYQDELLPEAVKIVLNLNEASTSLLQRKMRLGYARAARIIDEMEEMGIIGEQNGSKRREVLIGRDDYDRIFGEGN